MTQRWTTFFAATVLVAASVVVSALLVPLLVSHYRDSYQRRGGNR